MADNILRLRVDSAEYDSKLKRATDGIKRYADGCKAAGGTLEHLDEGVLDFVKALGQMDTVTQGTKGQLREMTQSLTDLTAVYRGLTDEEKASPFGQELSKGIQMLTERAGQARDAMADVQASIQNASSDTRVFDQVAQGASVLTAGFQGLIGAGKLLGIEMGDNVEIIAKLQAAMAVTNSLTTVQTALQKQSALMQGIVALKTTAAATAQKLLAASTGDATKAQAAYNAIANANPYVALATVIGTVVGALSLLSSGTKEVTSDLEDTKRAIDDAARSAQFYISVAQQLGASSTVINEMRLRSAKGGMEMASQNRSAAEQRLRTAVANGQFFELGALRKDLEEAQKLEQEATSNYLKISQEVGQTKMVEQELLRTWSNLNTEKEINAAIGMFRSMRSEVEMGSAAYDEYTRKITVLESRLPKASGGNRGGGGGGRVGSGSTMVPAFSLGQAQGVSVAFAPTLAEPRFIQTKGVLEQLDEEAKILQEAMQKATNKDLWNGLNAMLEDVNKQKREFTGTGGGQTTIKLNETLGNVASGMNQVVSGMEQLGIKLPEGIKDAIGALQGISTILTGIATTVIAIEALQGADLLIPFAHGGVVPHAAGGYMVPGTHYSGDVTPILANAGEIVMNRAMVSNLSSQLTGNNLSNLHLDTVISAEAIRIILNNNSRRRSKGEYVTTKMRN